MQDQPTSNEAPRLAAFWEGFQLSPNPLDEHMLKRWYWLLLAALGPLAALVLESFLIQVLQDESIDWGRVFGDLGDPIFASVSVALAVAVLLFMLRWRFIIQPAFQSLYDNRVLLADDEAPVGESVYLKFLQDYQERLDKRWRYIFILGCAGLGIVLGLGVLIGSRGASVGDIFYKDEPELSLRIVKSLHTLTRWVIAPCLWGYLSGAVLWIVIITTRTIRRLTPQFSLRVMPHHPDGSGGFKLVGDICVNLGIIIFVAAIPFAVFGIPSMILLVQTRQCVNAVETAAGNAAITLEESRYTDCLVTLNHALGNTDYVEAEAKDYLALQKSRGNTVDDVTGWLWREIDEWPDDNAGHSYWRDVFRAQDSEAGMFVILLVGIIVIPLLVLWPLWDIHRDMRQNRDVYKKTLTERAITLDEKLAQHIDDGEWGEAEQTREQIAIVRALMPEKIHYPTWPFRMQVILRSLARPSVITTLLSYGLSLLDLPEGIEGVTDEITGMF